VPWAQHTPNPSDKIDVERAARVAVAVAIADSLVCQLKTGVHVDDATVDSEIQKKFKETFQGNMSARKQHALQILFSGEFDPEALGLDTASLVAVGA
jgi:hypothetical protein